MIYDFAQVLDADKGERFESTTGRVASRDIVQFIPFRDVYSKRPSLISYIVIDILICIMTIETD